MNEKLKEALATWQDTPGDDSYTADYQAGGHEYAILAAAARGEIPGFQLVRVEPTEKMRRAGLEADERLDFYRETYTAMAAASKEEFK